MQLILDPAILIKFLVVPPSNWLNVLGSTLVDQLRCKLWGTSIGRQVL